MKKIVFTIICLLLATAAYTKEQESQKFSAIITMEYNGKSLEELAEIEKRIKVEFEEEADSIKIDLNKTTNALPQSYGVEFIDSTLLYNGSSNITLVPGKIR